MEGRDVVVKLECFTCHAVQGERFPTTPNGPGYTGPDGLSRMPDHSDVLTVRQLIDLVAHLQAHSSDHGSMPMPPGAMPGGHGASTPGKVPPQ